MRDRHLVAVGIVLEHRAVSLGKDGGCRQRGDQVVFGDAGLPVQRVIGIAGAAHVAAVGVAALRLHDVAVTVVEVGHQHAVVAGPGQQVGRQVSGSVEGVAGFMAHRVDDFRAVAQHVERVGGHAGQRVGDLDQALVEVVGKAGLARLSGDGHALVGQHGRAAAVGQADALQLARAVVAVLGFDTVAVGLADETVVGVVAVAEDALRGGAGCDDERQAVAHAVISARAAFPFAVDLRGLAPVGVVLELLGARLAGDADRAVALDQVADGVVAVAAGVAERIGLRA